MLITCNNEYEIKLLKCHLCNVFEKKDLGPIKTILGMNIIRINY